MAIFSTFDIKFREKQFNEAKEEFGTEYVVLIKKSKLFLRKNVLLPLIFAILVLVGIIIICFNIIQNETTLLWTCVFLCIIRVILNLGVFKKFLDYKIDSIILTPNSLIRYDQSGLFSRNSKVIELNNLKTVSVRKKGIINSIFNNGDLLFLSEGGFGKESDKDRKGSLGEIIFTHVYHPEKYRKVVNGFLDKATKRGK